MSYAEGAIGGNPPANARRAITMMVTLLLALASYGLAPAGVSEPARRTLAIFIIAAVFWATEALPLYATSMLVLVLQVVFVANDGGFAKFIPRIADWPTNANGQPLAIDYKVFLSSLGNPIIILFFGGFVLSAALTRHQVGKLIASRLLRNLTHRPMGLLFAVMCITGFLSMWVSNTATTVMMLAILAPLLAQLPREAPYARALVLAVPIGANIGGMGTPIGTPPNAIALGALLAAGYRINFLQWMLFAMPLVIIMLGLAGMILYLRYRPRAGMEMPNVEAHITLDRKGWSTVWVLVGAVALWLTGTWHGVSDAAVALMAAAAAAALGLIDRSDVNRLDWDILILMWGGLALGDAMRVSGLVDVIVGAPMLDTIHGMSEPWSGLSLALFVAVLAMGLSTFMSNTATAALVTPLAIGLTAHHQVALAVQTALACSLAMAMPVSTPPNAIAFATGRFPASSLVIVGGIISLVSLVMLMIGYIVVYPLMLPG